jgi:hypothetical protein
MDQDITTLKKELIAIWASIPTALGGGNHGHAGSNQQSTLPWQQLLLPIHTILELIPQDFQQMQRPEHEPEKRPNTKNACM